MSMMDIVVALILIFVLSVGVIIGYVFIVEIENTLIEKDLLNNESLSMIGRGKTTISGLDYAVVWILLGAMISTILMSFFIQSHPVFFVLSILLTFVVLIISVPFANVFLEIQSAEALATAYDTFMITRAVWLNIPMIIFFWMITVIIVSYYSWRGDSNAGF